jgi:hypothetical protein
MAVETSAAPIGSNPNEGLDLDAQAPNFKAAAGAYQKVQCFNRMTKNSIGYLGSWANSVYVAPSESDGSNCEWRYSGNDVYLSKQNSPNDRFLGVGLSSSAGWGLQGTNWVCAVILNPDGTISQKADPKLKLSGTNNSYVYWVEDDGAHQNIFTINSPK